MKKLTLFICLTLISGFAFSQWVQQNPLLPFGNTLHSVYFTDVKTGYIVGDGGTILKTTDGGTNWNTLSIEISYSDTYKSIFFSDASTGYAVGRDYNLDQGIILKTIDGGETWVSDTIEKTRTLNSVYFIDKNTGYTVDWDGIIKTVDGGTSWNTLILEDNIYLYSVFFSDYNVGYAVGVVSACQGTIIKTSDGGKSWETLLDGISAPLFSVFFTDINTGYAVGGSYSTMRGDCGSEEQMILKTIDGRKKWTELNSVTNEQLNSIFFTDSQYWICSRSRWNNP